MENCRETIQSQFIRRKVYDPLQRVLHGLMMISVLFLASSGLMASLVEAGERRHQLWNWHIKTGYILIGVLVIRVIWGFIGPRFAHFSDFFKFLKTGLSSRGKWNFGHDPKAALLYLLLFVVLFLLTASGLLLGAIEHNKGPLREYFFDEMALEADISNLHLAGTWFVIGFIGLHVGALLWHRFHNKLPMFSAMVTGYQYRRKNEK